MGRVLNNEAKGKREPKPFVPGKIAYKVEELAAAGGPGRTALFLAIRDGKLKARKFGSATFVLWADYEAFLASLPLAREVA